jgi:hypothetical protein
MTKYYNQYSSSYSGELLHMLVLSKFQFILFRFPFVKTIMMGNDTEDDDSFSKPVGRRSVIYYGVGHMLNDITSACWFTYLLLFLTDIGLSPRYISYQLVSGLYDHYKVLIYFLFKFQLGMPCVYVFFLCCSTHTLC